jgi:hypothetical protein
MVFSVCYVSVCPSLVQKLEYYVYHWSFMESFLTQSFLNSLRHCGNYMYHLLEYKKKLFLLITKFICMIRKVLTVNSDCFPKEH